MASASHFNDAPILEPSDDQFGIDPFAKALAQSISKISSPVGVTIAVNGVWGSGKSSAINLIRHHLTPEFDADRIVVIDFKCWWFRGQEALTLAFLQQLNASLSKSLGEDVKDLIPKLGKALLQAEPVIGPAINLATGSPFGTLFAGSVKFADRFFSDNDGIEATFEDLSNALQDQKKKFLVIIDDIDRLNTDEALLVFRLVKSVGRLPNVIYLLAFDHIMAEEAVNQHYPSEGPHFLEKIVQARFELPLPLHDDLNSAVLNRVETICGPPENKEQKYRFLDIFYDYIAPNVTTPRDVTRLVNMMTISWPPVQGEVDIGDYVALEAMRLFEPALYNAVRSNKDRLVGTRGDEGIDEAEKTTSSLTNLASTDGEDLARIGLLRLFPRLRPEAYSSDFLSTWEAQRLVCTEKHFDTYFRMSIGEENLSTQEVDNLIAEAHVPETVKKTFESALSTIRRNGKSMVPILLDELKTHADRIPASAIEPLLTTIFEIADKIERDEDNDQSGLLTGTTHLRIHWLVRKLTIDRFDLAKRSEILLSAASRASLGWLVDFTSSSLSDYFPREGSEVTPPENCLVTKQDLETLKLWSLNGIGDAAFSGKLINRNDLAYILYRWRDFADDNGVAVIDWTGSQLHDGDAVAKFAKAFTSIGWSIGLGSFESGLSDRVSRPITRADVQGLDTILDINAFRHRLEELEGNPDLTPEQQEAIDTFLGAWRAQDRGKDW